MDTGAEQRDVGRQSNKGGVYQYQNRPPRYGTGVEQGRGYGRQLGYPGRGINFRQSNFEDPSTQRRYCKFFNEGRCKFGGTCQNIHDLSEQLKEVMPPQPCKFYAQGHCKFGVNCRNIHSQPDEQ